MGLQDRLNPKDAIQKQKKTLVAQGNHHGQDSDDTFIPIALFGSKREPAEPV